MSTFLKELTNPKTGKKQVAVCHDNHFGGRIYGYGFKQDGSDFEIKDFEEKWMGQCDFYREDEMITPS